MTTTKASKKRKQEDQERGDNEEEHKRNSLRCDEANIKVIVGGEQGEGYKGGDDNKKVVFWHYSHILASQSRYVDALLSAPLAAAAAATAASKKDERDEESNSSDFTEITFPDISPSQWKRMIKFLTDPVAARDMSKEDAIEVIIPYDKYDFSTGINLCDEVLSSIFYEDWEAFKNQMNDLDLLDRCVDVVVLSHEKNLKKTLENAKCWLYEILSKGYDPEIMILTVDHIRKLGPVIESYIDDNEFNLQSAIEQRSGRRDIDIRNPMFPDFFVAQIQLIAARNTALKLVNEIEIKNYIGGHVYGTYYTDVDEDFGIDGTCIYYKYDHTTRITVRIEKNEVGDWTISEEPDIGDAVQLFICKGSRCATLPPKTGWERIDVEANSNLPIINYYHMSTTGRREIDI